MVNTMKLFGRTPLLSLLVLILFGACGAYITVVLPSIVKVLVQDYGITGTQAGYIVSWEKFGMALASLGLFLVINRWDRRLMALGFLIMLTISNGLSAHLSTFFQCTGNTLP